MGIPSFEWHALYNQRFRDRLIQKKKLRQTEVLELSIRETTSQQLDERQEDRSVPVEGYNFHSIGGTKGIGIPGSKIRFFRRNQHKGIRAHDIFIQDNDQDG